MNKVIKKIFRSLMYIVGIGAMALVPDAWLWHIGVGDWPLPLAIVWWIPSLLIILAEVGLQLGKFHRTSVRVLFTLIRRWYSSSSNYSCLGSSPSCLPWR